MRATFNAPPGWPVPPPGWLPEPGWRPDPSWPEPPHDWLFHLPDARESLVHAFRVRGSLLVVLGASLLGLAAATAAATSLLWGWDVLEVALVALSGLVGTVYAVQGAVLVVGAGARATALLARRPCVVVPVTPSSRPSR